MPCGAACQTALDLATDVAGVTVQLRHTLNSALRLRPGGKFTFPVRPARSYWEGCIATGRCAVVTISHQLLTCFSECLATLRSYMRPDILHTSIITDHPSLTVSSWCSSWSWSRQCRGQPTVTRTSGSRRAHWRPQLHGLPPLAMLCCKAVDPTQWVVLPVYHRS